MLGPPARGGSDRLPSIIGLSHLQLWNGQGLKSVVQLGVAQEEHDGLLRGVASPGVANLTFPPSVHTLHRDKSRQWANPAISDCRPGTSSVGREMEDEVTDESFARAGGAPQTGVRPPV